MILICGFQKCGNTACRFIVFNYFNILKNNAIKTLTYRQLSDINRHRITRDLDNLPGYIREFDKGFPPIYHTHHAYDGQAVQGFRIEIGDYFKKFNKLVYLYRNPFDVMISYWNWMMDRDEPWNGYITGKDLEKIRTLDGHTKKYLPKFIHHAKITKHQADLVLNYDQLMKDPNGFRPLLQMICDEMSIEFNEEIFQRSITMSSFTSIKKMGNDVGQPYGLASTYRGQFTRNGKTGQYKDVMKSETINYIIDEFIKAGLL